MLRHDEGPDVDARFALARLRLNHSHPDPVCRDEERSAWLSRRLKLRSRHGTPTQYPPHPDRYGYTRCGWPRWAHALDLWRDFSTCPCCHSPPQSTSPLCHACAHKTGKRRASVEAITTAHVRRSRTP